MELLRTLGLTVMLMVGAYLAVFLSYILIPASVFLFIFFIVHTIKESDTL
jgi:hypothetical protein